MNYYYFSPFDDAHKNLAIDEHFLNSVKPGELYLFIYINRSAVIIGRNQNPWKECDVASMKRDGVQLVRRFSGGGAVYHDAGNLNFSFISAEDRYDEAAQAGLLLSVLDGFGIKAELTGRNDLCADGRKFSGNAWCRRNGGVARHGTLLINTDMDNMRKYLTPRAAKLEAHGVDSVRGRVCNLSGLSQNITVGAMATALEAAFRHETRSGGAVACGGAGVQPRPFALSREDNLAIEALHARNASDEWALGECPRFDYTYERRFDWGMAELCVNVRRGAITGLEIYTDAMDAELPGRLRRALIGKRFNPNVFDDLDYI